MGVFAWAAGQQQQYMGCLLRLPDNSNNIWGCLLRLPDSGSSNVGRCLVSAAEEGSQLEGCLFRLDSNLGVFVWAADNSVGSVCLMLPSQAASKGGVCLVLPRQQQLRGCLFDATEVGSSLGGVCLWVLAATTRERLVTTLQVG
nr:hypothetical protein [Tanacetum cinerariifolium]